MNKKSLYIVLSVSVLSLLMNLIDVFVKPNYFIRSIIKVVLFLIVPMIYFVIFRDEDKDIKKLFVPRKKDFLKSLGLGIVVYSIILTFYLLFRNFYNFSVIAQILTSDIGVNAGNFIYVSLYISFFNSLLEEFFFRGYAFITLKKQTNKAFAYIFSSAIFAFYHIGMTSGWFNIGLLVLMLLGLFIGGIILNYLNEKSESIYHSWLVHMFANFAINTVGFILFGIM